ncbi:MAG TPA: glycosyltransferase family 4 protein [Sulfuricurvum sp.]|nr:glycosyltransferase family 4 protein [Sulfuricurvum sp.]
MEIFVMIHLSFFTKYPTQGATSRYRSFMFAFRLSELDYNIELQSFMDIRYLSDLFAKKPKNKIRIFLSYCARLFAVLRSSDHLIIERELFPFMPYGFERLFLCRKRYILDFDDNVWEDYREKFLLEQKYDSLVKHAAGVIVGNDYLEHYVKKLNPNVIKIPTVVNLEPYKATSSLQKFDRFTLVWIGSPITYRYIEAFALTFQKLAENFDFDLIIVASKALELRRIEGVSMKFFDWSSETEPFFLKQSHVGIMPLTDDPFSQGKSGFKLIQYQAAGLPMIASPIGENNHIVEHGINGFLASDTADWLDALRQLLSSQELYKSMSDHSTTKSYDYSIQKYFPIYKNFIDETFTPSKMGKELC